MRSSDQRSIREVEHWQANELLSPRISAWQLPQYPIELSTRLKSDRGQRVELSPSRYGVVGAPFAPRSLARTEPYYPKRYVTGW